MVTTSTLRVGQRRGFFDHRRAREPARRHQLDATHEPPARERLGQARLLRPRDGRLRVRRLRHRHRTGIGAPRLAACGRPRPLDRGADLPDVLGRRPAAAANQAHTGGHEASRVRRHVFRRTQVDVAPLDIARPSGVGHGRQPDVADDGSEPLDRLEHGRRPDAAVHANDAGPAFEQHRRELFRRRPVETVAVLLGRHLRHDGQRADLPHRRNRGANLVEVAERLEDKEVNAALDQGLGLVAEELLRFVDAGLSPRLDPNAERTNRAGDVDTFAAVPTVLAGRRAARNPRPFEIDRPDLLAQPEGAQLHPVGAEGVGLDDVGAGPDVGGVDLVHQLRLSEVERLEAAVDEDPASIELGAHRTVADQDPAVDLFQKGRQRHDQPRIVPQARQGRARSQRVACPGESFPINQQVRAVHAIGADRDNAIPGGIGGHVVVTEEVEPGPQHVRELTDLGLANITAPPFTRRRGRREINPERRRRLVCQQHVNVTQPAARVDLLAHEVAALVGELRRLCAALARMRERGCRRLVPRRRERAADASDGDARQSGGLAVRQVMQLFPAAAAPRARRSSRCSP